ncbi:protein with bacteriocin-type signal sequence [Chryseobacterium flavum]|uniref:Protein with bacteriocin-type signal sequence n=1 Tax=Chryseobacterium flavum TaxID=415851 RepID=A0A3D9CPA4_9FLAO|nr:protein with bacteriocin-type signal sequence [Chryseobacterium flavum]REC67594.1 protein with bacteriocin-type signal sequence [Chryseobacterium flavum]
MKNLRKLSKSDLKMVSGGWVPPPGGYCPEGYCQYTENGACRIYDPEKCY